MRKTSSPALGYEHLSQISDLWGLRPQIFLDKGRDQDANSEQDWGWGMWGPGSSFEDTPVQGKETLQLRM